MFIISFNIMFKDANRKIILTETPYLFVNQNLREITNAIRNIVREDFLDVAEQMSIPATKLTLGMTTLYKVGDEGNMHFFEVDVVNVRELQEALLNR